MDMITLGLGIGGIVVTPLGVAVGAAVKKSYTNEKRLTVLETNYTNVARTLTRIENEQRDQTNKLDRLIEKFL